MRRKILGGVWKSTNCVTPLKGQVDHLPTIEDLTDRGGKTVYHLVLTVGYSGGRKYSYKTNKSYSEINAMIQSYINGLPANEEIQTAKREWEEVNRDAQQGREVRVSEHKRTLGELSLYTLFKRAEDILEISVPRLQEVENKSDLIELIIPKMLALDVLTRTLPQMPDDFSAIIDSIKTIGELMQTEMLGSGIMMASEASCMARAVKINNAMEKLQNHDFIRTHPEYLKYMGWTYIGEIVSTDFSF